MSRTLFGTSNGEGRGQRRRRPLFNSPQKKCPGWLGRGISSRIPPALYRLDFHGSGALFTLLDFEAHSLAFLERLETVD
jgi:hypothetical protein